MRLGRATAAAAYNLDAVATGHAHVGVGAFHRAHQAEYADDLLADGHLDWGIVGINLREPDLDRTLAPQDGLYHRVEVDGMRHTAQVLSAIRRTVMADRDPAAAVAALADPQVSVVTLSVTEKGMCHVPATGALNHAHADIAHDAAHPARPRSAPGLLVAALAARRAAGQVGPALISCDNVAGNGAVLRTVVVGLAAMTNRSLADWIAETVAFPSTMVDRIVPATRPEDLDRLATAMEVRDEAAVFCEPFRQWVIENAFRGPRPPWELAGAEIVADVAPYETMKHRMLNGCQSALACLGWLGGCDHTSDAMAQPNLAAFADRMMARELATTVTAPTDLDVYRARVLTRLANTGLRHTTWQIATDGSQKIPQRLVAPFRERLLRGQASPHLALSIAGWMQFVATVPDLPDTLAAALKRVLGPDTVASLLSVPAVFGELGTHPGAHAQITHALSLLRDVGPIEAAARAGAT